MYLTEVYAPSHQLRDGRPPPNSISSDKTGTDQTPADTHVARARRTPAGARGSSSHRARAHLAMDVLRVRARWQRVRLLQPRPRARRLVPEHDECRLATAALPREAHTNRYLTHRSRLFSFQSSEKGRTISVRLLGDGGPGAAEYRQTSNGRQNQYTAARITHVLRAAGAVNSNVQMGRSLARLI